jgi:hypothetical protein
MSFSPRTFRCPNCNEMINESVRECGYCSVAVDPGVAQLIADKQQQANQACSAASYLRTATIAMYVFMALSLIPFLPLVELGFVIVFVVVVVLLISWQVRYSGLVISDPDYETAKRSWWTSFIMMIVAAPLGFVVRPLIQMLVLRLAAGE